MLIAQIIKGSHDPGVTTPYSKITIKSLFSVSVYLMYGTEAKKKNLVFPRYRLGKDQDLRETKLTSFPRDHTLVPSYLFRLSLKQSCAVVIGARATTA